jgi:hypothetical protein
MIALIYLAINLYLRATGGFIGKGAHGQGKITKS